VTIDTDVPSVREISYAISKMKNGKAPGADGISADLPQADKSLTFIILSKFFCEIRISENILEDWKTGLIRRLAKEENLSDCNNWWGISLFSRTNKVLNKFILKLFTTNLENDIRKEKAGFRKGISCSDLISTLRSISTLGAGQRMELHSLCQLHRL